MKVSRNKTEYMCMNEGETDRKMSIQRVEVVKLDEFKYLVSTIQSNRQYTREVKKRV